MIVTLDESTVEPTDGDVLTLINVFRSKIHFRYYEKVESEMTVEYVRPYGDRAVLVKNPETGYIFPVLKACVGYQTPGSAWGGE